MPRLPSRALRELPPQRPATRHLPENADRSTVLAALLSAIAGADARLASAPPCADMLGVLLAEERGEDLAAGLPSGTRIAHKNGWITGVRHGAA